MIAERGEFLSEQTDRNKGNGFRLGHTYGHGRKLEFKIPRDRFGNFHPKILAILRDQEKECEKLAGSLYTKGLTQTQVGQVFDEIYGEHNSKSSISRMIEYVRKEVDSWLHRDLDSLHLQSVFINIGHNTLSALFSKFNEIDIMFDIFLYFFFIENSLSTLGVTCNKSNILFLVFVLLPYRAFAE